MKAISDYFDESIRINPLLDRAYMALEENSYTEAKELFDSIIISEPRNALAYLGSFLCDRKTDSLNYLVTSDDDDREEISYKRMLRFADDDIKRMLADVEAEKQRVDDLYSSLIERYNQASTEEEYRDVAAELDKLNGYKLSGKIAEVARERAGALSKDKEYEKASALSESKKPGDLVEAGKIYAGLGDWKDSSAKLQEIRNKITAVDNYYNTVIETFNSADTEEGFIEVAQKLRLLQGYKHSEQIAAEAEKRAKELEKARIAEEQGQKVYSEPTLDLEEFPNENEDNSGEDETTDQSEIKEQTAKAEKGKKSKSRIGKILIPAIAIVAALAVGLVILLPINLSL